MKTKTALASILLSVLALPILALAAATPKASKSAKSAQVHAILITASNKKGGVDRRLAAYAENLKGNLPFDTFRFTAEDRAVLPAGGRATVTFAGNHRIELEDDPGDGLRLNVYWLNGPDVIIRTTLTLAPGVPAVLGRRGGGEEVPVVLLIAK